MTAATTPMTAYTFTKKARLLACNVVEKSKPPGVTDGEEAYFARFGIDKADFDAICGIMKAEIVRITGEFESADTYTLCCKSPKKWYADAAKQLRRRQDLAGNANALADAIARLDGQFEHYKDFGGIVSAKSKFDIGRARLSPAGVIDVDIRNPAGLETAKGLFYPGAYVAAKLQFRGFRGKKADDKDGVTAFLQNICYLHEGDRLGGGNQPNAQVFDGFKGMSDLNPLESAASEF